MKKSLRVLFGASAMVVTGLFFGSVSFADESAPVSADVCARSPLDFQRLAFDPSSRLALTNQGGIFGGGVCWWHSRLQRSSLYLAMYRPDLAKPSRAQGQGIINALASMNQVVVIPGYANFNEFSRDYEREILSRLESWQRSDGILKFRWIDGLRGSTSTSAQGLQYIMGRIHDMVAVQHRIVFEKLQLPGISTHAWLIIGSTQTPTGYTLDVIDSNEPGANIKIEYHFGDRALRHPYGREGFMPYLDFEGDLGRIFGTLHGFCKR